MEEQNNINVPSQTVESTQPVQPAQPVSASAGAQNSLKKLASLMNAIMSIGGMISGMISIILGIVLMDNSTGVYVSHEYYGGDAYTGIQQAAADTARNVMVTGRLIRDGLGYVLIIAGLIAIFAFGSKLFAKEKR